MAGLGRLAVNASLGVGVALVAVTLAGSGAGLPSDFEGSLAAAESRVSVQLPCRVGASNGGRAFAAGTRCSAGRSQALVPAAPGIVGVAANAQGYGPRSGMILDRVAAVGVRWVREDFRWADVERWPGVYDWSRYDRLLTGAALRGIHVLPLLQSTPAWAGPRDRGFPRDAAGYGRFVAATVARYGPGGTFWRARPKTAAFAPQWFELWNEPYFSVYSTPRADPGEYARLFAAGATAGRAANPAARFLIEADTESEPDVGRSRAWVAGMYASVPGLSALVDGVAVHPYATDLNGGSDGRTRFRRFERIAADFGKRGAGDKPLWITEIGWSTCPACPEGVSEAGQAARVRDLLRLVRTRYARLVAAVFVFGLQDPGSDSDPTDKEGWFGLVRADGSAKPALAGFRDEIGAAP